MNQDNDSANQRVMSRVMQEIYHIPIPGRRARYGPLIAVAASLYTACLVVMWMLQGAVHAVWQWMIATLWVSNVEWLTEHPQGLLDVGALGVAVVISAWIVRTRGQSRG